MGEVTSLPPSRILINKCIEIVELRSSAIAQLLNPPFASTGILYGYRFTLQLLYFYPSSSKKLVYFYTKNTKKGCETVPGGKIGQLNEKIIQENSCQCWHNQYNLSMDCRYSINIKPIFITLAYFAYQFLRSHKINAKELRGKDMWYL